MSKCAVEGHAGVGILHDEDHCTWRLPSTVLAMSILDVCIAPFDMMIELVLIVSKGAMHKVRHFQSRGAR